MVEKYTELIYSGEINMASEPNIKHGGAWIMWYVCEHDVSKELAYQIWLEIKEELKE